MTDFKVGDRVRLTQEISYNPYERLPEGLEGTVVDFDGVGPVVDFRGERDFVWADEIELVAS